MSESPILELNHISIRFGGLQALEDVSFDLREGEVHALVGENGAGKSTLMRILSGVYTEYGGEYVLDGQPVQLHSPHDALNRGIGMIHQELSVMPELSVAENLFLGRQPYTRWGVIDWKMMNRVAEEEMHKLGFDIDVRQPLGNYSLGIQQVAEVLRVILSGARVLIMDEPTSALSPSEVERLIELTNVLRALHKRSIIYISHFLDEVMRVADRITVLRDGRKVSTLDSESTSKSHLISLILGREQDATLPSTEEHKNSDSLLSVQNLSAEVFNDISFEIGAGEIVGLYGPVGAGHFDVARTLFGMFRYDSGTISVDGHRFPSNFSAQYAIAHGVAYATESRRKSLFMDTANYANITLPHLNRIGGILPQYHKEVSVARKAMKAVNVQPCIPDNSVGTLSGGNQQKVAIARWITFPPRVFVVSEPTRGMDVGAKNEVLSILIDFRNQGFGVLVVSSEPETVLAVADRIIVMSRGKIVSELQNSDDLQKDALMRLI
ncbi:MAG: sugar ABC transporter ATP-binding protein [Anaerolineae bacterium]|nr:sugar ABC transporter ATP-binding protein [Anaerolineae bacterium]